MVERINAQSQHYRDVLQRIGRDDNRQFSNIRFYQEHRLLLKDTLSQVQASPQIDNNAFLITHARDTGGRSTSIVSVTRGAIPNPFLQNRSTREGSPNENELWFVNLTNTNTGAQRSEIVLTDSHDSAIRIGARLSRNDGWHRNDISAVAKNITGDELKRIIDRFVVQGRGLPPLLAAYAELSSYYERRAQELKAGRSQGANL